ncbi:unnamed protein product [Mytilus edulis]|uniref:Uncharacterized protein n=1 Tax=Mytilus edulis TaxID=6550 RepID=A0A8S3SFF0_MYTED|nr:unnamed protein product [Mytilus edulis]
MEYENTREFRKSMASQKTTEKRKVKLEGKYKLRKKRKMAKVLNDISEQRFELSFWLAENLVIEGNSNTSLDFIYRTVQEQNTTKDIITSKCVANLIKNLFPDVKKSSAFLAFGFPSKLLQKCLQFVHNKKKKQQSEDKENSTVKLSKEEILVQLKSIAPNLHDNQLTLIQSQIVASNMKSKKEMRWDKDVICMALSLFNRNPAAYRDITQNSWLNLPSEQLIKLYKNAVQQKPGIVPDMMLWMSNEAKRQKW